jgi:hypothetical protein
MTVTHSFAQTKVVNADSAKEFLDVIRDELLQANGVVSSLIFRGVGKSHYELTPTALRRDENSRNRLNEFALITLEKK